jgi:hypothetical protein
MLVRLERCSVLNGMGPPGRAADNSIYAAGR